MAVPPVSDGPIPHSPTRRNTSGRGGRTATSSSTPGGTTSHFITVIPKGRTEHGHGGETQSHTLPGKVSTSLALAARRTARPGLLAYFAEREDGGEPLLMFDQARALDDLVACGLFVLEPGHWRPTARGRAILASDGLDRTIEVPDSVPRDTEAELDGLLASDHREFTAAAPV